MALYATHIRFALDIKDDFGVTNLDHYLSGTVYPDSRYFSQIDRELTHSSTHLQKDFYQQSDFNKGWYAHVLYDKLQFKVFSDVYKDFLLGTDVIYGNDEWLRRTCFKILQDIDDVKHFDIRLYLSSLQYVSNPNHENIQVIEEYNKRLMMLYNQAPDLTFSDYNQLWVKNGMNTEIGEKLQETFIEFSNQPQVEELIKTVYDKTVMMYKSITD